MHESSSTRWPCFPRQSHPLNPQRASMPTQRRPISGVANASSQGASNKRRESACRKGRFSIAHQEVQLLADAGHLRGGDETRMQLRRQVACATQRVTWRVACPGGVGGSLSFAGTFVCILVTKQPIRRTQDTHISAKRRIASNVQERAHQKCLIGKSGLVKD